MFSDAASRLNQLVVDLRDLQSFSERLRRKELKNSPVVFMQDLFKCLKLSLLVW
jgi:hypothetical protein